MSMPLVFWSNGGFMRRGICTVVVDQVQSGRAFRTWHYEVT